MKKILAVAALLVLACGKRGDPRPPVPVIPQATSDLVVTQRADQVILSWSYPSMTTAGRSLTGIRRISVHRYTEELPASAVGRDPNALLPGDVDPTLPQPVALFARIPTLPLAQFAKLSERVDSIEKANLATATAGTKLLYTDRPPFRDVGGRPVRITYAVVTEGEDARGELSNLAVIVPLPVATAPAGLTATPKPGGVELTWDIPKTSIRGEEAPVIEGYHVYRTAPGETLNEFSAPINNAPVKTPPYTDTPGYGEHEYRLSAVATTGPPLVQSSISEPVRTTFKDLVPPPVPTELTPLVEPSNVRLVWNPVEAADLAGYKVYRTEGQGHGTNIREIGTIPLHNELLTVTNYIDTGVNPGIAFRYSVTAIDKSGNESARATSGWVVAPKTP
ncbi:MAG TPA: hypothetical protein VEK57_10485 [Thermoanaerobaculia bacterium]|nr:hypothetical protein [Thermoanaerobaculia bacterium]